MRQSVHNSLLLLMNWLSGLLER